MKISGTKKSTCLNSSYKMALVKIRIRIIETIVVNKEPNTIPLKSFLKILFSTKGINIKPESIIIGILKKIQMGRYVGDKFWAFMHSPNVSVHTLWMWFLKKFTAWNIICGFSQKFGFKIYTPSKNINEKRAIGL